VDVDATKPACRFDVAEIGSMDFEAWIPWTWMRRSRLGGLMRPKSEAWIPKLGFRGHGCDEASLEVLMRPKFEAWIPKLGFRGRGCYEAGLEV